MEFAPTQIASRCLRFCKSYDAIALMNTLVGSQYYFLISCVKVEILASRSEQRS